MEIFIFDMILGLGTKIPQVLWGFNIFIVFGLHPL